MESWKVLVEYVLGPGARPEMIQEGKEYPGNRIVKLLVPVGDTFIKLVEVL